MAQRFPPQVYKTSRFPLILHLLVVIFFSVRVHSQCVAPAAGPARPAAPTLDAQILAGDSYVTGTGIPGDTVIICVNGNPTVPPTTVTVAQDGTFQAPINVTLTTSQQVTAQQYAPGGAGAPVYSDLSNVATVGDVITCLEALQTGECQFRVEINTSAAVGNNSQTNTNTTPNIIVTLDYQWHSPKNTQYLKAKNEESEKGKLPSFAGHLHGKTGYTQTFAASSVQPTPTNGGTAPPCPTNSQSPSSGNCTLAIPKPTFIGELGAKFGYTTAVDGAGFFGEFGLGGRGSFQYLFPTNQIVQNNGASYIDLNATNPHNVVGFYEATGYAQVLQHDHTLQKGKTENSSPLLVVEGGYQNNRALAQLLPTSPGTNTRSRYVGRFTFNYEVSKTTHSQISLGMEYSGAINGGPHVVQIFVGGNLNPAKLFGSH